MTDPEALKPAFVSPGWLARPWLWMLVAFAATGTGFLWARGVPRGHQPLEAVQVPLVAFGVLSGGIAISRRFSFHSASTLDDLSAGLRRPVLFALAATHATLALGLTVWVLGKGLWRWDLPGSTGGTVVLWLLAAPWAGWSAWKLVQRAGDGKPLTDRFEKAALVTQSGIVALLASWALYWGTDLRLEWDSLRLLFAVLAGVAMLCAPLVAANSTVRRIAVSGLILIHFAAIVDVVIGSTPGPWVAGLAHQYIFRHYLDFMYLNNAYRFYSPEPSEASQIWFRIEYRKGGKIHSRWTKLPELDDQGNYKYLTGLQYTRRLALSENISKTEPFMPQMMLTSKDGRMVMAEFYKRRDWQSPNPQLENIIGEPRPAESLKVPYHPDTNVPNYLLPNLEALQLLGSYARYVLSQPHPDDSEAKPESVKIYRVKHRILPPQGLAVGADPRDWIFFLPYYQGEYDTAGRLMDPHDPFLYWLLPILRENENDPDSPLKCYVFKHAGDKDWVRQKGQPPRL